MATGGYEKLVAIHSILATDTTKFGLVGAFTGELFRR